MSQATDTRTAPADSRRAEDDPRLPKRPTRKMTLVIEEEIAVAITEAAHTNRRSLSHQVNTWLSEALGATGRR